MDTVTKLVATALVGVSATTTRAPARASPGSTAPDASIKLSYINLSNCHILTYTATYSRTVILLTFNSNEYYLFQVAVNKQYLTLTICALSCDR